MGLEAKAALAMAAALILGGCTGEDEIDAESAALLKRMPRGSAFSPAVKEIEALGFSCDAGELTYVDGSGQVRKAQPHFRCQREEPFLLVCSKRTSALLIQRDGRLANVLVNIGRFCP